MNENLLNPNHYSKLLYSFKGNKDFTYKIKTHILVESIYILQHLQTHIYLYTKINYARAHTYSAHTRNIRLTNYIHE